tara:strand:+ start:702 stop:863 length:162 start_codon:yes stop_codon:yes gene_type:complete
MLKTYKIKYNNDLIKYFNTKDFETLLKYIKNKNNIILIKQTNKIPKNKYITKL